MEDLNSNDVYNIKYYSNSAYVLNMPVYEGIPDDGLGFFGCQ